MLTFVAALVTASAPVASHADLLHIPAFARRYRVSCARCHSAAPKLNPVGEAFRLNGYQFPEAEPPTKGDPPQPLGEEPWKDLWPRAVYPGEIPAAVPVSLRIQSDVEWVRAPAAGEANRLNFRFPQDVYVLAGGSLGERIGFFFEGEWNQDDGVELRQAKVTFQRLIPSLGPRAVNLWLGLQNLYLFTFADRQIDRATRQPFLWQRLSAADVPIRRGSTTVTPATEFALGATQPAIEVNGLAGKRLFYAVGLAQGSESRQDDDGHKDVYGKIRLKLGGFGLDGTYPLDSAGPGAFGQIRDRSVILEGFGYAGREAAATGETDHRAVGANLRVLTGPLDLGAGVVRAVHDDPYQPTAGRLAWTSVFAKGEWFVYPWLIASLKGEWLRQSFPAAAGTGTDHAVRSHVMPGAAALIRPNIRLVVEGDTYPTYEAAIPGRAPRGLWIRLDLAF
ncbi:MAG: hypothetical protein AB7L66_16920 [Gemmatimonadales bacterium]